MKRVAYVARGMACAKYSFPGGAAKPREIPKVPLPILLVASPVASRLRRQDCISRALTIPPATQAMKSDGLIVSLSRVRAKSFSPADRAKIGARAKIDGDRAGGGSEDQSATLALLGFI